MNMTSKLKLLLGTRLFHEAADPSSAAQIPVPVVSQTFDKQNNVVSTQSSGRDLVTRVEAGTQTWIRPKQST